MVVCCLQRYLAFRTNCESFVYMGLDIPNGEPPTVVMLSYGG